MKTKIEVIPFHVQRDLGENEFMVYVLLGRSKVDGAVELICRSGTVDVQMFSDQEEAEDFIQQEGIDLDNPKIEYALQECLGNIDEGEMNIVFQDRLLSFPAPGSTIH